ncbi:MAG: hypothetical protein Q9M94_05470 [Candidatus Gracilibacteria bacterium]|nr:hypothetical protein [Candidatus Gracilibacteria bacterium]MDQ7022947.1 hypothetical protein [Candidatus Gracilibacteria bacterium]
MQKLKKLVKNSSKENFYKLRKIGEIKCNSINKIFKVTGLFYRHVSGTTKNRALREIIERLSSISLIEKNSEKGELIESRENIQIEKFNYKKSYKIKLKIEKIDFFIILAEKNNGNIILISVFLNYLE